MIRTFQEHGHSHDLLGREHSYPDHTTPLLSAARKHLDHEGQRLVVSQFTIQRLAMKSCINFFLAILCLVYVAVNVVCLIMNSFPHSFRHNHAVSFHLMEFWATFAFSIVSLSSFVVSRRPMYQDPVVLKLLLFMNIVFSAVPAILVTESLETFEIMSHEMEYFVGCLQAIMDIVILHIIAGPGSRSLSVIFLLMALAQVIVYNFSPNGEQISHFLEFSFEIGTATILFLFCVDNKLISDGLLCELLHQGRHNVQYCELMV